MAHIKLAADEKNIPGRWTLDFNEEEERTKAALPPDAKIIGVFQAESAF
jgi:hypothetical protein